MKGTQSLPSFESGDLTIRRQIFIWKRRKCIDGRFRLQRRLQLCLIDGKEYDRHINEDCFRWSREEAWRTGFENEMFG